MWREVTDSAPLTLPETARDIRAPVARLVRQAAGDLLDAGVSSAQQDARQLAAHVFADHADPAEQDVATFFELVARRVRREPLERLIGAVQFRSLKLLVGPGVFVPQPETSSVVSWAVDRLREMIANGNPHPLCVDLCTGSGTIALSLAAEVPQARVHAVELDEQALSWARRNAEHHGLSVTFHHTDAAQALPELSGQLDLVASNPPYVATGEMANVRPEVRDHDPAVALGAGADGLDVIRCVEEAARRLLHPGGLVVVEHSDRQGRTAPAVFSAAHAWADIEDHQDHEQLDRFVTARRF